LGDCSSIIRSSKKPPRNQCQDSFNKTILLAPLADDNEHIGVGRSLFPRRESTDAPLDQIRKGLSDNTILSGKVNHDTQQISTQGYVTQAEYDKLQVDLALAQNKITLLEQKAPGLAIDGYYGNLVAGQPITLGVKVVPSGVQISNFNVGSSDSNIVDVSKDINGNIVLTPRKASLLPVTITVAAGVTEGWLGTSFSVTVQ
jgi:hypothetical protein